MLGAVQLLVAVIGVAVGIKIGFALTRAFRVALLRISPEHYMLAGAVGFIFGALWVVDGHSAWPLVIWFGPAAVLEGIASATSLERMQSAS